MLYNIANSYIGVCEMYDLLEYLLYEHKNGRLKVENGHIISDDKMLHLTDYLSDDTRILLFKMIALFYPFNKDTTVDDLIEEMRTAICVLCEIVANKIKPEKEKNYDV